MVQTVKFGPGRPVVTDTPTGSSTENGRAAMPAGVRTVTGGGGGSAGSAAGAISPAVVAAAPAGAVVVDGVAGDVVAPGAAVVEAGAGEALVGELTEPVAAVTGGADGLTVPLEVAGAPVGRVEGGEPEGALASVAGLVGPPEDDSGWVRGGMAGLLGPIGAVLGVEAGGEGIGVVRAGPFGRAGTATVGLRADGGTARFAAGGAPFSMRVRSLAVLCCDGAAVWSAATAERIRTLDMARTIAPQPLNGKLCGEGSGRRQFNPEDCALAGRRNHANGPALELHQSLCQGQTDSVSLHRGTLKAKPVERLEQLSLLFRRQTRPLVDDLNADTVVNPMGAEGQDPATRGIFHGVGGQVVDDLCKPLRVGKCHKPIALGDDTHLQSRGLRAKRDGATDVMKKSRHIGWTQFDLHSPGLGARHIEKVMRERLDLSRGLDQHLRHFPLGLGHRSQLS